MLAELCSVRHSSGYKILGKDAFRADTKVRRYEDTKVRRYEDTKVQVVVKLVAASDSQVFLKSGAKSRIQERVANGTASGRVPLLLPLPHPST
jgi:hypothetical protein